MCTRVPLDIFISKEVKDGNNSATTEAEGGRDM